MLITSLLPLLARYSLGFDLVAGPDDTVTLTIIPRKADPKSPSLDSSEIRPISITASAAEIDAELGRGVEGALGGLIATRKTLADQIAEQRQADEDAKAAAADAAMAKATKTTVAKPPAPTSPPNIQTPTSPPADAGPEEPATLF
ncbi:MAG: hypothetical protein JWQ16_1835 [Novosphingobium sp.]|nr:hypothetical protein [Novosphingobium sp.]